MTVNVAAHFPGELMLAVASDQVHRVLNQPIGKESATIHLPVDIRWGPRPYVLATVFRKGVLDDTPGPSRALGAAGFGVHLAGAALKVTIEAADVTTPDLDMPVNLSVTGARPGSDVFVTLAAVDAGISVYRYAPPDPQEHFLGQRRLAVGCSTIMAA